MRRVILALMCVLAMTACGWLSGRPGDKAVTVRLRLVDSAGATLPGIVRLVPADGGKPLEMPGLYSRLRGLSVAEPFTGWFVLPRGGAQVTVPRGHYRLEALSGLETALARIDLDLRKAAAESVEVKLEPV